MKKKNCILNKEEYFSFFYYPLQINFHFISSFEIKRKWIVHQDQKQ